MGRTACEKLFKIDDGVGCNCVPQSYAVSKVSSLKKVLALFLLNHHASSLMMLPPSPSQKIIQATASLYNLPVFQGKDKRSTFLNAQPDKFFEM